MIELMIKNWKWVALRGALAIVFGALTLVYPGITLVMLVVMFGAYAVADGAVMVVSAIANRRAQPRWGLLVLGGVLGIAVGVLTFVWPGMTALVLLAIIASWAILMGVIEIAVAIWLRKAISGEWVMVLSGVLAIAFGALLLINPIPGALAVVLWIGAYAVLSGVLLLVLSFRLRNWGRSHGSLAAA